MEVVKSLKVKEVRVAALTLVAGMNEKRKKSIVERSVVCFMIRSDLIEEHDTIYRESLANS